MSERCPLCGDPGPFQNWRHSAWKERKFHLCSGCDALFVPAESQVSPEKERERYATHNNDLEAAGFRDFLLKTVHVIEERLPRGARILDFGSGPEPSLSKLLTEAGYEVVSFDPFFNPVEVKGDFDLVLAHEVFEHLREPFHELAKIREWLRPQGIFLIRSEPRPSADNFPNWWYARDFTHIFFASEKTLFWISRKWNWRLELWSPHLWALRAPGVPGKSADR